MRGKRVFAFVLMMIISMQVSITSASAVTDSAPTRIIHVVFDDSGSMIKANGQLVDTWCQAKYAMEVFAAMLGENDTMNVYVMSDFDNGRTTAAPKVTLAGADGQATNVSKVHSMLTSAGNTPFNSVRKAYSDLNAAQADEKWLVILTDGQFQGIDNIDAYLAEKAETVKVMFLGMGPDAPEITANEAAGIYYEKAATSKQILNKITGICTRIFNSDRLDVNVSAKTITFDVPMAELTVFAQGANVSIKSIKDESGTEYLSSSAPVTVQYSEKASAANYPDFVVDKNLKGSVLTFKDDFSPGTYMLEVSGADTIEVYYKPNVEIAAYLTNETGEEVSDMENLKAGEYTIDFGFVKAGTRERVAESALLGEVSYSAIVINNGVQHETAYTSGDKIYIEEGSLQIDAVANFLEYNSVATHLDYSIFKDKNIEFSIIDLPEYVVTKEGLDVAEPIQIKATLEGTEFSEADWAEMGLVKIVLAEDETGSGYGDFIVEKDTTPGVYCIIPSLEEGQMRTNLYQDCLFTISYNNKHGEATWAGEMEGVLKVSDTRSWLERNLANIIRYTIFAMIALLILGYIPPFKKYLPRRLKRRPSIDCSPNRPGVHQMTASGRFTKRLMSTVIPYRAEKGSIKFTPSGVAGVAALQVKAAGGSAMYITNVKAYAGKDHITFNGSAIPEETTKPVRISAGAMIAVNTKEMTYTCVPNQ